MPSFISTSGTIDNLAGATGPVVVTGLGFQPKALIMFGLGEPDHDFGGEAFWGIGFTDGTNHFFRNFEQQNAVAGGATYARQGTSRIYNQDLGGLVILEVNFTSFDADGFTVDILNANGDQELHWIALGGDDFEAKVGTFSTGGVAGAEVISGAGFEPQGALFIYGQSGEGLGFGAATAEDERWAYSFTTIAADPTVAYSRQSTSHIAVCTANTTVSYDIDITSFDADGITLDKETVSTTSTLGYLLFRGAGAVAGSFTQDLSTGEQNVTGINFAPSQVIFGSYGFVASGSQQQDAKFSMGVAESDSDQRSVSVVSNHAVVGSSDAYRHSKTDKAYLVLDPASPSSPLAEFSYVGALSNGFRVDWIINDAVSRQILYLALGEGTPLPRPSRRRKSLEVKAGGTHYMTFKHETAGLVRDDFTVYLIKNDNLAQGVGVEIREISPFIYVASFVNDKEDHATWTLLINDPNVDTDYLETWKVRKLIAEQNIKQLRARQDSEIGFFKTSTDKE